MEGTLCSALMCDNSLTYTISHQGLFGGPLYHQLNILNRIFANIVLKLIIIMFQTALPSLYLNGLNKYNTSHRRIEYQMARSKLILRRGVLSLLCNSEASQCIDCSTGLHQRYFFFAKSLIPNFLSACAIVQCSPSRYTCLGQYPSAKHISFEP